MPLAYLALYIAKVLLVLLQRVIDLRSERRVVVAVTLYVVKVLLVLFQTVVALRSERLIVVIEGERFRDIELRIVKVLLVLF